MPESWIHRNKKTWMTRYSVELPIDALERGLLHMWHESVGWA